jgi:hypothetical protein
MYTARNYSGAFILFLALDLEFANAQAVWTSGQEDIKTSENPYFGSCIKYHFYRIDINKIRLVDKFIHQLQYKMWSKQSNGL